MQYPDTYTEDSAWEYAMRFEMINAEYLVLVGKHIKELGRLTVTDVHRMSQMAKMGANIKKINEKIVKESNSTLDDLYNLYDDFLESEYRNVAILYAYRGINQKKLKKNKDLINHLNAVKKRTRDTFYNISKTTSISDDYKKILDASIVAVQTGLSDYQSEIRKNLKEAARGMRVTYESGVTRRLDSAMYMNVQEGIRQLNIGMRDIMGQQFEADGIEISAHALCAPDHVPVQGLQYASGSDAKYVDGVLYESYDTMNENLRRHIGTWNCKHYTMPIVLGVSEPAHTQQQIDSYKSNSERKISIAGKERSKYQWSQQMRVIETKIRYAKEKKILGKAAGNTALVREANAEIDRLQDKYDLICKKTGLEPKYNRTYVPNLK